MSCAGTIESCAFDAERRADHAPRRLGRVEARSRRAATPRASATSRAPCPCRACPCRRRSARRGSRAGAGCAVPDRARTAARASPGTRARRAAATTAGVITPRSSATTRQRAELRLGGAKRPQRPARDASGRSWRSGRPAGTCQYDDEAAEVVDPHEVEELERPPEPLDPPAVAGPLQRRPVVERVPPELTAGAQRIGRRAGDRAREEELRVGALVGAVRARRRSGRLRSAGRPARPRRRGARPTPRSNRTWSATAERPARRSQSSTQYRCCSRNAAISAALTGASGSASSAGRPGEHRLRPVRRAGRSGGPTRQHLPPRLPRGCEPVDELERRFPEPSAGKDVRCSRTPLERPR